MIFPNEIFCRLSNWNIVAHCPNNGRIEQRCNFPLIVHIFIALRTMPGHISKIPPNIRLWEQWRDINSLVLHNICTAAVAVNTLLTVDLYTITPPAKPRGKWSHLNDLQLPSTDRFQWEYISGQLCLFWAPYCDRIINDVCSWKNGVQ